MKKRKSIYLLIITVGAAVIIGLVYAGVHQKEKQVIVRELQRPDRELSQREYQLEVLYNGETSTLTYSLDSRQLTLEEIDTAFEQAYEFLIEQLPGDNMNINSIYGTVNLIQQIEEYQMSVDWYIEDREVINYYGEVYNVDTEKKVQLTAVLSYKGETEYDKELLSREYQIEVTVIPKPMSVEEQRIAELEGILADADFLHRYEGILELPEEINGKKITFFQSSEQNYMGIFLLLLTVPLAVIAHNKYEKKEKEKKRKDMLLMEYPQLVMKLSLFIGAGMTTYNAFAKIAMDYQAERNTGEKKRMVYEEVCILVNSIKSGKPEGLAYSDFGRSCGLHSYIKLGTLLEQNVLRGNEHIRTMLRAEVNEAMSDRKARARKAGEQAGTKLLLPMLMMLAVVLIIIMFPALTSF